MTKHGSHGVCERCQHSLQIVNSIRLAGMMVSYVGCRACNWRPPLGNKIVKPAKRSNEQLELITT